MADHSKRGPRERILAAFGANAVGKLLTIASQLVLTAACVSAWGASGYGEWLMLTAVPAYLLMADVGVASATANEINILASRGKVAEATELFRESLAFVICVGLLVAAVGLTAALTIDFDRLLNLSQISRGDAAIVVLLLVLQVSVSLPGELLLGGFRVRQEFATALMLGNAFSLVDLIAAVIAVLAGGSPVAVASSVLVTKSARLAVMSAILTRRLNWPGAFRPRFSLGNLPRLARPALGFMAFPLARALNAQGMILLVGHLFGPTSVVVFAAARTLCRSVSIIADLIASSVYAEMSTAVGDQNRTMLLRLLALSSRSAIAIAAFAGVALLASSQVVTRYWLGAEIVIPFYVLVPLVIAESAASCYRVGLFLLAAANSHFKLAVIYCIQSALMLVFTYLSSNFGLVSAPASVAIFETFVLAITFWNVASLLRVKVSALLFNVFLFRTPAIQAPAPEAPRSDARVPQSSGGY